MTYQIVCNARDRSTWLEVRRTGLGASDMATVLGCGFEGVLALYYDKIGETVPEVPDSEQMELGRAFEGPIIRIVAKRAGVTVSRFVSSYLLRSDEHPWCLATPDAMTVDGEPVEVKNLSAGYDEADWAEGIPEKYFIQCQQQMLVTGAARCLFGACVWGRRIIWEWVPRCERTVKRIIRAGEKFWRHVETRTEPPSDGHKRSREALASRERKESAVELYEADVADALARYTAAKASKQQIDKAARGAKKELSAAEDDLATLLGANQRGYTSTGVELSWHSRRREGYVVEPTTITSFKVTIPKEEK